MSIIAEYDYVQPTEATLIAALSTAVDAATAKVLVAAASRKLNKAHLSTPDDVVHAAEVLMEVGDLLRVTARSEKVRAVTYRALRAAVV